MEIIIIGAGNWGTTLAVLSAENGYKVKLWTRDKEHALEINRDNMNKRYLPGYKLPGGIIAEQKFNSSIKGDSIIVIAVPSTSVEGLCDELIENTADLSGITIICASKGWVEVPEAGMATLIKQKMPENEVLFLAGPIANEVMNKVPSVAVLAAENYEIALKIAPFFQAQTFKIFIEENILGVEIASAMKHIVAIIAGICDGLKYTSNTKGALISLGFTEMVRVGFARGIPSKVFYNPGVLCDLLATSISKHSRNRQFGEKIGSGESREDAIKNIGMVVEGVNTLGLLRKMCVKKNIITPLINTVYDIVFSNKNPEEYILKFFREV